MTTADATSIRDLIVAACERVLARTGYDRLTMADVAAEAGLARRTLYLHFKTKEALVFESVRQTVAHAQAGMERCFSVGTGREALRAMLAARVMNRFEYVADFVHSTDEIMSALRPHGARFDLANYEKEVYFLELAIEMGRGDRTLRSEDPHCDAELLIRATNDFLPSRLPVREARDLPSVRRKLDRLIDILIGGLATS